MYINEYSNITFEESSTVTFSNKKAYTSDGGAIYINDGSTTTFEGNSTVTFSDNKAFNNGGGMYISYNSAISFLGDSKVTFSYNVAPDNYVWIYVAKYMVFTIHKLCPDSMHITTLSATIKNYISSFSCNLLS